MLEHLLQSQNCGSVVYNRQHDNPKGALKRRVLVKMIENDVWERIFLSSTTMRIPVRSLSSRSAEIPSTRLSLTREAMFWISLALLT